MVTTVAVLARGDFKAAAFRAAIPGHEFLAVDPLGALADAARAEVAIGGTDPERLGALLAAAPGLRWYATTAAGVDRLVAAGFADRPDLVLTNNAGAYDVSMAEHAIALMFSAAKGLSAYTRSQAARAWVRGPRPAELRGATLVVHGMGAIGSECARLAAALGMDVIGVRRRPGAPPPWVRRVVGPERLLEVAREADYLVAAAPLTPATRGSISAAVLAALRPTAWLVNIGRGAIVDEDALVAALAAGRIGGAALDVFSVEPLPKDHALWALPNVIITPHASALSPSIIGRTIAIFAANLERWNRGEPIQNRIDPEAGY